MTKFLTTILILVAFLRLAPPLAAGEVVYTIDPQKTYPISPYIYGANFPDWKTMSGRITATRWGGNRTTAYNWETNASNAGSDWKHQNDAYMGKSDIAGDTVRKFLEGAAKANAAAIVTIPCIGYVAADKGNDGDVNQTPDYLHKRFHVSLSKKDTPFKYPPDAKDKAVYQDEFIWWIEKSFGGRADSPILYALDNEPDLWANSHARLHPKPLTFQEIVSLNIEYASAVKRVAPKAQVVGLCSFGWSGWHQLQNAPDRNGRDFLDFYCQQMSLAEQKAGKRLIDVIDLHYYSEARANGTRVIEDKADPAVYAARIQSPRSLWDPTYKENSWIVNDVLRQPMAELRRVQKSIAENYPGTKLALAEYDFGGSHHISGAIAEADALGIFGREGVYLATNWRTMKKDDFVYAGLCAYRDYDGDGGSFGATGLAVTGNADPAQSSLYASRGRRGELVLVAINKTEAALPISVKLINGPPMKSAAVYRVDGDHPTPKLVSKSAAPKPVAWELPALSVSTIVLEPAGK